MKNQELGNSNGLNRRSVLGLGGASLLLPALGWQSLLAPEAAASPLPLAANKKLLTVFLRGGNDAVNTIIPASDSQYYQVRLSTQIKGNEGLDLGNGWATFHPSLAKLLELYDDGEVAAIQRVGYPNSSQSHFSAQRFIETATPGDDLSDEGFVNRWATEAAAGLSLPAVSVSAQIMRQFKGPFQLAHIPEIASYTLGSGQAIDKLRGLSSSEGLRGIWNTATGRSATRDLVNSAGLAMDASVDELENLPPHTPPPDYYPTDSTDLSAEGLPDETWAVDFFGHLKDAVRLLKQTDARVAGVEIDAFDLHAQAGSLYGDQADRLHVLAHGLRSIRLDTQADIWDDLVVLVFSEFGRTSIENDSLGTDHGGAGAMIVAGGKVNGGVYNCDSVTWPANQTLLSQVNKYVLHLTDYRTVLAEIFNKHMCAGPFKLDKIIPGWSSFSGPSFDYLGLL